MKDIYYWEEMKVNIIDTLKSCKECMMFNNKGRNTSFYPLLVGEAFEKIGIDLMGPFSVTKKGNKYIIVAIDYLTKIVEIDATNEKSALNVANFIYEKIICNHGCPESILSDNGRELYNAMIQTLCERLKIDKKFSSPYRPQTNGLVERTNRTLIAIIAKYVSKYEMEWDECLEQ